MNVAEYVADFLVRKGVKHVFGFQGGAILKLIDEFIKTEKINYIQNYHEQASAFAADAYSRVTGNIGVALATSGPGATNLITGIANAQLDSIPALFITGQDYTANIVRESGARQNGFQDLNIVNIVEPITKYTALITDPNKVPYELDKAFHIAKSGRPGAVLLDIPIDVQFKDIDFTECDQYIQLDDSDNAFDLSGVISLICNSKRPLIIVGGGIQISKTVSEINELIKRTKIPVVATVNGLDATVSANGFAGLHGNTFANLAVKNADLILAFGVRFGQRQVGKIPNDYSRAHIVHVDIDDSELNRIFEKETAIKADLKIFLSKLNEDLINVALPSFESWQALIETWIDKYRNCAYLNKTGLDPVQAVEKITSKLKENSIITNDVGQNQMWVAQGYTKKIGQRLLNSCGLGSMGYSLPAAIGAKIACPDKQVIAFTGDGGLQMNLQELIFVGHRGLGIKTIVFNNNTLGMMREVQARYYEKHYYGANKDEFTCINLEQLAATLNIKFCKIKTLMDLDGFDEVLEDESPYIVELVIDYNSMLSNRYDEAHIFEEEKLDA
ncbi:MAG: thiamine pyrophosphate-binding protein [Candidatus Thiodiazotropha sp. (ex Monitilora ramsayi)]|nr:thiamine pyrophosphate-binding protein [Candidatus Thiodiazotropha sp. (ex Monitilora ramsayi)]